MNAEAASCSVALFGWCPGKARLLSLAPYTAPVPGDAMVALLLVGPGGEGQESLSQWRGARHTGRIAIVVSERFEPQLLRKAMALDLSGYWLLEELGHIEALLRTGGDKGFACSPAIVDALLMPYRPADEGQSALTRREREVLSMIGAGQRVGDLAATLGISRHTAAGYIKSVYRKLGVRDRASAALQAVRLGLVS